ncbi:MAG: hypothetical protein EPN75_13140 [Beijerinckiaceae bacterium]|nr:MAG: hypothetical protein EPN75_13140 [Beijerinckiaceae bacterium]
MKTKFCAVAAFGFAFSMCAGSYTSAQAANGSLPNLQIKIQRAKEACQVKPPEGKRKTPTTVCQTRYDVGVFNTSSNKVRVDLLCRVLGKGKFKSELHFDAVPSRNMNLPVVAVRLPDMEKGHRVRKTSCVLHSSDRNLTIF